MTTALRTGRGCMSAGKGDRVLLAPVGCDLGLLYQRVGSVLLFDPVITES